MTDPRPRPQYGEYAPLPPTPAENGAATPSGALTPVISAPPVPPAGANVPSAPQQRGAAAGPQGPHEGTVAPVRKQRLWDVMLTATLLFFGVVDVINTFSMVGNLGPILREGLAAQGVDSFTSDAIAAEAVGVANIVRVAVLILTIVLALIQIQRKRIAFWIPIIGATIAAIALMVAIFVAVLSDPGFIAYVESLQ